MTLADYIILSTTDDIMKDIANATAKLRWQFELAGYNVEAFDKQLDVYCETAFRKYSKMDSLDILKEAVDSVH